MKWFLLFILSTASAHADTACWDLEKAWRSKYTVDFRVAWNLKGFQCPGGESTVAQALWDLEHLEFEPNPDGFRPDFYKIVSSRIGVLARNHFKKGEYAYEGNDTITVCLPFYRDERWDRASTLVHESRHDDPDDPMHVMCTRPPNRGLKGGCDARFFDGTWRGSGFNADIVFFSWLTRAKNNNELSQAVIDSHINELIPDRFNIITAEQIYKWRR